MANSLIKEIRTKQVVDATKRCIVEKGFANLSVKDIAREAGVSTGVIYHYFKNKEDILLQVIVDAFRKSYEQVMDEVDPIEDPGRKLMSYIEKAQAVPQDNPDFQIVMMNYLGQANSNPEITNVMVRFFNSLTSYVADIVQGQGNPTCRIGQAIPAMVIAMSIGTGILSSLSSEQYDSQQIGEAFKQLIRLAIK